MPNYSVACEWQAVPDLFAVNELGERDLARTLDLAGILLEREVQSLVPHKLAVPDFAADTIEAAREEVRSAVEELLPKELTLATSAEYVIWKIRPNGHEVVSYTLRTDLGAEPQPWELTVVDGGIARKAYVRLHIIVDAVSA